MSRAELQEIDADHAHAVAEFLHLNLDERIGVEEWECGITAPCGTQRPNLGFMLADGSQVVGALLAFYSDRQFDGLSRRVCNLSSWCVLPEYRFQSMGLLKAVLDQPGYNFTDFTPTAQVVALNRRLGFSSVEAETLVTPNLPWPSWPGSRISADPAEITQMLNDDDLDIYRDHRDVGSLLHFGLAQGDERCYVMLRKQWYKRLPLAMVLHVTNPELLCRLARPFSRHLLLRHRVIALLTEERVLGRRPKFSFRTRRSAVRMVKGPDLKPDEIDYLYSELVRLPI